jgi:hypothetical protein
VGTVGATCTPPPLTKFEYVEPSLPTIVAVPETAGEDPKSKVGVSVAEPPWWMTEGIVVRLMAFAGGTTLTVRFDVTLGPVEGVTVSVYVNAPLTLPVTVTFPPFAMDVAERVPAHAGAQESVAAELPRPVNEAQSFVVPPLPMFALPVEAACDVPTLKAVMRALTGGRALST